MCIMEIHPTMPLIDMIQALAHNLSTIDRDLTMLRVLPVSCETDQRIKFLENLQTMVHRAYAYALAEFGMEAATFASDSQGHIHGQERDFAKIVKEATEEAKVDETR